MPATSNLISIATSPSKVTGISGAAYFPDSNGYLANVPANDVPSLLAAGFNVYTPFLTGTLLGTLMGANMNTTADQAIPLAVRGPKTAKIRVTRISVTNASISLTTAAGGVYTAASKGGTALVSSGQAHSALTGASVAEDLTLAVATTIAQQTALYLSLTTAQGAAATADIYVYGDILG